MRLPAVRRECGSEEGPLVRPCVSANAPTMTRLPAARRTRLQLDVTAKDLSAACPRERIARPVGLSQRWEGRLQQQRIGSSTRHRRIAKPVSLSIRGRIHSGNKQRDRKVDEHDMLGVLGQQNRSQIERVHHIRIGHNLLTPVTEQQSFPPSWGECCSNTGTCLPC